MFTYSANIIKVVDGDTIDAQVDLGFKIYTKIRFRLVGVDTAEIHSSDPSLREKANIAKDWLSSVLLNKTVTIVTQKQDKYGRWLATVIASDSPISINEQLIKLNYAKSYNGVGSTKDLWE